MRHHDVALVHRDERSDFGVSFPDFPGCITAGSLWTDAAMAAEALARHVDLMADEGHALPEPSTLDAIMADADNRDGVPVLVPVSPRASARGVRVNITLPEDVLARIDAYAAKRGV